ncbi:YncE family protein [Pedobacter sp. GR22-6]|uniref:YncE family protein n=1 Tax=Pedobacter sp. GR22-6 TaxID=3127957 RepID=UPI00307E62D3
MKKSNLNRLALSGLLTTMVFLNACKKDRIKVDPIPHATAGVYVLCEGAFGQLNNSSITYYDVTKATVDKDYFRTKNGAGLGTDASDLKQYGSKMYCLVTGSKDVAQDAYIEVINIATGKSIKRIPFYDTSKDFAPRHIAFYQNKAYVTGYDGYVSKIDTASLTVESRILVGGALEGIAIVNGKIFAANSSHPFYVNANNSNVSVVDIASFTKVTDIPVSFNPTKLAATANGDVYVITSGSFSPFVATAFEKINSLTNTKTQTFTHDLSEIAVNGNSGYVITNDYPAKIKLLNISTGLLGADFITETTSLNSAYGLTVNPLDHNLFIADATNYVGDGKLFCFDTAGKKKFEFATGTAPKIAVFNYTYK